ncbi:MAG: hypothetical protein M3350_06560 [Actinomycetota bacterium]|nr:hypothetical protein [Actinomycetota bacterium]
MGDEHDLPMALPPTGGEDVLRCPAPGQPAQGAEEPSRVAEHRQRGHEHQREPDDGQAHRHEAPGDREQRVQQMDDRPARVDLDRLDLDLDLAAHLLESLLDADRCPALGVAAGKAPTVLDELLYLGVDVQEAGRVFGLSHRSRPTGSSSLLTTTRPGAPQLPSRRAATAEVRRQDEDVYATPQEHSPRPYVAEAAGEQRCPVRR